MPTRDWRRSSPVFFASATSRSRARFRSLASVGNMMFLGCTVVSTITLLVSSGRIAPVFTATDRLSCSRDIMRSSPILCRQRVIEERSKGRSCRKKVSPQKNCKRNADPILAKPF